MLELAAAFICFTSLLTYLNYRFVGLPPTIGVMVIALIFSVACKVFPGSAFPAWNTASANCSGRSTSTTC